MFDKRSKEEAIGEKEQIAASPGAVVHDKGENIMANICDQRVVIVAKTKDDMAECLEKMVENVLNGPAGTEYFSKADVESSRGDANKLYELLKRCLNKMSLLCLFSTAPDSRTESGWMGWQIEKIKSFAVVEFDIGVKWGPSYDPGEFCSQLDPKKFASSISDGGEYCEWEYVSIDGDWIDAEDVADKVSEASRRKNSTHSMSEIAYWVNLAGIDCELYQEYYEEE